MKDRFLRLGSLITGAVALLAINGLMYSCSDDYDLPDKKPEWLGKSIYEYLKDRGNFTNTVNLINDLDYAEVMSKTGSKTLFVANDDAYAKFYEKNPWGVSNYSQLTSAQKKMLFNGSMLDNPYLLEMLSSTTSSVMNTDGKYLSKNTCLRRSTSLTATDSVAFYEWDSEAIPHTYNTGYKSADGKPDNDYWARFRMQEKPKGGKGGIRLATDNTVPMMTHWIAGQMGEQKITASDFKKICGDTTRKETDVYIFGSKVVEQDITCQNGYINVLDKVFTTPANMAEMIRTNGKTNYYSHLLDRFSAPYYNATLTNAMKELGYEDSVFVKGYFNNYDNNSRMTDPNNNSVEQFVLKFDPGWNAYAYAGRSAQSDMGAMLVPSDEAMAAYFIPENGGGRFLMDAYATEKPVTTENLARNLDQIPMSVIKDLINNLMLPSFIESVPSKYLTIMNDARDPLFTTVKTEQEYLNGIDTCLIANNGVVYVLNAVYTPATYAAVSAPALVSDSLRIFNWAITADDAYITNPNSSPLQAFISTYLKAMSTNFAFFIPSDNAMKCYYDPVSMGKKQPRVIEYGIRNTGKTVAITGKQRTYDPATGEVGDYLSGSVSTSELNNRLKDMIDSHIFVDSTEAKLGIEDGNEWFVTRNHAPIKVVNPKLGANGCKVYGGWQLEQIAQGKSEADNTCTVTQVFDKSARTNKYGNGMTYIIDHPIQSTVKSTYKVMEDTGEEDSPYYQFMRLCDVDMTVLEEAGIGDEYTKASEKQTALNKYVIFNAGESGRVAMDYNVRFFNTYKYTVYLPTNESVKAEIENGLPTWPQIEAYINERIEYIKSQEGNAGFDPEAATREYKTKAKAMITVLLNFVKYHFQDNSIFADNNATDTLKYETATIDTITERYMTVRLVQEGGHRITVLDNDGRIAKAGEGTGLRYNMLARDLALDSEIEKAKTISTSSFVVLHQLDNALHFMKMKHEDGSPKRYDEIWASTALAKKFIDSYPLLGDK